MQIYLCKVLAILIISIHLLVKTENLINFADTLARLGFEHSGYCSPSLFDICKKTAEKLSNIGAYIYPFGEFVLIYYLNGFHIP